MVDKSGDGMLGSHYYNRGRVTFRPNYLSITLTALAVLGMTFVISVVVGAIFYSKPAQNVLQSVVDGIKKG